ncbi:MAG: response regulator transcription factor [Propionibacteriaceae bacterium]|jgi:DNA-binding NarL/FixJ family response regulator|nr:response regulator transcription factor [Propionibacteriaceae bacterium]
MLGQLKIAVVEDNAKTRNIYARFFEKSRDFQLVGVAAEGRAGVDLYLERRPDVMVMDLMLPVMSGVAAVAAIRAADPTACVLPLTTLITETRLMGSLLAGAAGCVQKSSEISELRWAVEDAYRGSMPLSPLARQLLVRIARRFEFSRLPGVVGGGMSIGCSVTGDVNKSGLREIPSVDCAPHAHAITSRESDLLCLLVRGFTNEQIAKHMFVSEATVKKYLGNIGVKLGARTRTQIVVGALCAGLVELPEEYRLALAGRIPAETVN